MQISRILKHRVADYIKLPVHLLRSIQLVPSTCQCLTTKASSIAMEPEIVAAKKAARQSLRAALKSMDKHAMAIQSRHHDHTWHLISKADTALRDCDV